MALLRAAAAVEKAAISDEERQAFEIVRRAATAPLRQIATNAGLDASLAIKKIREAKGDFGLNAATGQFGSLKEMGIIDPAKVTYHALVNAASIAAMLLTTDTLISDLREKKKAKKEASVPEEDED